MVDDHEDDVKPTDRLEKLSAVHRDLSLSGRAVTLAWQDRSRGTAYLVVGRFETPRITISEIIQIIKQIDCQYIHILDISTFRRSRFRNQEEVALEFTKSHLRTSNKEFPASFF